MYRVRRPSPISLTASVARRPGDWTDRLRGRRCPLARRSAQRGRRQSPTAPNGDELTNCLHSHPAPAREMASQTGDCLARVRARRSSSLARSHLPQPRGLWPRQRFGDIGVLRRVGGGRALRHGLDARSEPLRATPRSPKRWRGPRPFERRSDRARATRFPRDAGRSFNRARFAFAAREEVSASMIRSTSSAIEAFADEQPLLLLLVRHRSEGYRALNAHNHTEGAAGPRSQEPGMALHSCRSPCTFDMTALTRQDISTEQLALIAD